MEKRLLGKTNHMSTVVIFGAAALGNRTQEEANAALDLMAAAGINHIDVAASYGKAETLTGPWLESRRDQFFVSTKTEKRDRAGAWEEIQRSLQLLHTSYTSLHQIHAVTEFEEMERALGPGGAIEAFQEARDRGMTRYLGITGHGLKAPAIFIEALNRFDFDTVLFPINAVLYANADYRRDAERLLSLARERNVGIMAIKSVAKGPWNNQTRKYDTWYEPFDLQDKINQGVRFTLSQPGVTGIPSAGDVNLLPKVIQAGENYQPMTAEEQAAWIEQSRELEPLFT
ncbi:MAG: aldo/keto reductase [Anaerolineae bacterium]|nr:aldo/keto reductase [Anaerolineae bacterium]